MCSHENTGSTFLTRAFTSQTMDFSVIVHPVVFQDGQLHLLVLVFDLFGSGVILLLTLLAATTKAEDQVQGGLCKASRGKSVKIWLISLDRGYAAVY